MKLTTKGKYAILGMYDLARHFGGEPQSITSIAKRQHVPEQYLVQLMKKLREHDLVESTRGVKGGYILSRPPQEITIGQIICAVEEQTRPIECFGLECDNYSNCVANNLWTKIGDAIENVINHETLADMLNYPKNENAMIETVS